MKYLYTALLAFFVLTACSSTKGYRSLGDKEPAPQAEMIAEEGK